MGFGNILDIDYQIVGAYLVVLAAFQTHALSFSTEMPLVQPLYQGFTSFSLWWWWICIELSSGST